MGILNVDNIQPVGGGTTITLNSSEINVGTGVTFESNGQANFAGVVTATSFSGSGANLTSLPSQVTINNASANRVLTSDGGTTLNGEANLTFDGDDLLIRSSTDGRRISFAGDGTSHYMKYDNTLGGIILNGYGGIAFETNGTNERLRITSGGQIRLPVNGQQLTWGASQQMKFYYENSEDRMYLQGDGAYGFAFRVNGGNRIEISKTTGDVVMQGLA